jgi:outer membrane protein assembly factor BamB
MGAVAIRTSTTLERELEAPGSRSGADAAGPLATLLAVFISERRRRRRPPLPAIVAVLALIGAAIAAYVVLHNRTQDVHRGDKVEFNAPPPPRPRERTTPWLYYHYDLAHTGYLAADLKPPFKEKWLFSGHVLMEFPPIVVGNSMFFIRNNGGVYKLDADTGRPRWKNQIGRLAASSPTYSRGLVFVTSLSGKVVALHAKNGKLAWQKVLPSRTESSPIVHRGVLYFGTEGGELYALYARSGRVKWKFGTSGAIKGSPALSGSTLYVGDYSGRMYAVWMRSGRERWSTGTSGSKFGFAAGRFYSTPAVGFGRVFAGNTDGKVYSFGARTGELAWSKSTSGYVYSSPAIANVEGTQPSVYVGSYDGTLYALDARSGAVRWTRRGGGRISGGVTVVGRIAYFADLDSKSTFGVDVRNGDLVVHRSRGAYNPVISDGRRIYLTGYASVTALEPVHKPRERKR